MKTFRIRIVVFFIGVAILPGLKLAQAGETGFTYQGRLEQSGVAVDGAFDLIFNLLDGPDPLAANQIATQAHFDVPVSNGLFQVEVDFGVGVFTGATFWLEIEVRPAGIGGTISLVPLQKITRAPYAVDSDTLDGLDSSDFISSETDPSVLPSIKDGVDWTEISGIPADFADGVDNTGTQDETDPTVPESIKDGVAWEEIASIPSGFLDGVDNTGQDNLGNHTATTNLILNEHWISGDGDSEGIRISPGGNLGVGTSDPQERVHIDGAVVLANSEAVTPVAGTIRWNLASADFEGFNGDEWVSLTGAGINTLPEWCPNGGFIPVNDDYCVQDNRSDVVTFDQAVANCEALDPSNGRIHLCTHEEWVYACEVREMLESLPGNMPSSSVHEWVFDPALNGLAQQRQTGSGHCPSTLLVDRNAGGPYRCCFDRR